MTSHPDTLLLANNLAAAYLELGRCAEAEALLQEVVAGRTRVLGEDHDQTAMSIHNLGVTLAQLGRYEEAEIELRRAIAIREHLPGERRSLLFSMSYLADVAAGAASSTKRPKRSISRPGSSNGRNSATRTGRP